MIRINKYLTEVGHCSRREADRLIEQKRVKVNGIVPEMGTKVGPEDEIRVDGKLISGRELGHVYIAFNKPVGIVSTTDTKNEPNNIIDYIGYPGRIFPIGRLDKDSEGLILLTSDGDIVNKILRAENKHEKEYMVITDKSINDEFVNKMSGGIPILGKVTRKCIVKREGKNQFRIVLTEGMNRQIRRMCEFLGYKVVKLKRVRIINIKLDIPVGHWRYLDQKEMTELNSMIGHG